MQIKPPPPSLARTTPLSDQHEVLLPQLLEASNMGFRFLAVHEVFSAIWVLGMLITVLPLGAICVDVHACRSSDMDRALR